MSGRNLNSGDTCSIDMYKETLPIVGKWKVVSVSGVEDTYKMLGKEITLFKLKIEFLILNRL